MLQLQDYELVNGYPNNFWGWGGEDDELMKRIEDTKLQLISPQTGNVYDMEQMDIDTKVNLLRTHTDWKCNVKTEVLAEHTATWKQNGLNSLHYEIESEMVSQDDFVTTLVVNVQLNNHWTDTKLNWQDLANK
jgi:N-terminal domain of galactosyltransferase